MDKFNELSTFVDTIHKQLKEQDYINLMNKLSDLRETIKKRGADYLVEIQYEHLELKYLGDNEYKFEEYYDYQKLVFNEKDICEVDSFNRKFDEKEFLALRKGSNLHLSESGQLQYGMTNKTSRRFILHDSECDDFGTNNSDCDCARLEHKWTATTIWNIEKL